MSVITIGTAAVVLLFVATPAAAKPCCARTDAPACTMAACGHHDSATTALASAAADQPSTRGAWDLARQTMTVQFDKPIKIGDRILLGRYFIEHDDNRMARGWPCTYIYAASDPRLPVVAFHCTHLHRPRAAAPTIVVRHSGEANGLSELLAFQFAGETAGHGVPKDR